jgi:hypothetical protein
MLDVSKFITPGTDPGQQGEQMLRGLTSIGETLARQRALAQQREDQAKADAAMAERQKQDLAFRREQESRLKGHDKALEEEARKLREFKKEEARLKAEEADRKRKGEINSKLGAAITSLNPNELPALIGEARLNGVNIEYAEEQPEASSPAAPAPGITDNRGNPLPSTMFGIGGSRIPSSVPAPEAPKPPRRLFRATDEKGNLIGEYDLGAIEEQRMRQAEGQLKMAGLKPTEITGILASTLPQDEQTKAFIGVFEKAQDRATKLEIQQMKNDRNKGGKGGVPNGSSIEMGRGQSIFTKSATESQAAALQLGYLKEAKQLLERGGPVDVARVKVLLAHANEPGNPKLTNQDVETAAGTDFFSGVTKLQQILARESGNVLTPAIRQELYGSINDRIGKTQQNMQVHYQNSVSTFRDMRDGAKLDPSALYGARISARAFGGLYKDEDFYVPGSDDKGANMPEVKAVQQQDSKKKADADAEARKLLGED